MARSGFLIVLSLLCALAGIREFRAGIADYYARSRTSEGLRAGLGWTPDDSAKWRQLGIVLIRAGSADAAGAFERAVALHPFDADSLIGLALEAERTGQPDLADRYYRRASECSRRFKPKYAQAGFLLRAGRLDEFWQTAAEGVNITAADVTPMYKLAGQSGAEPNRLPELLRPGSDGARAAYISFALPANYLDSAAAMAMQMASATEYRPVLEQTCEKLIRAGRTAAAVSVWNRLPGVEKLDLARGQALTDLHLSESATPGFGWRFTALPGTAATPLSVGSGINLEFSGEQPERGAILERVMPVLPGRTYRLTTRYNAEGIEQPAGLWWVAMPLVPGASPITAGPLSGGSEGRAEFTAPSECTLVRVILFYERATGTVRIAGRLQLESVRLERRS